MARATRSLLLALLVEAARANHYTTLGVPRDASADTIKAAYRKAALKHHPDRTRGLSPAEQPLAGPWPGAGAEGACEIKGLTDRSKSRSAASSW